MNSKKALKLFLFTLVLILVPKMGFSLESFNGFLVSAYDDRFRVLSPEKFNKKIEVVIENKTLVRLVGKIVINKKQNISYVSIDSQKYKKFIVDLKKGDVLHFIPLSPAFQEIELIVGNKTYEIPPK